MAQGRADITISLYATVPQDYDNSVASVKPLIDGLKGIAIEDDAPEYLSLKVETIKIKNKKEERTEISL